MAVLIAYLFYFIAASVSPLQRRQLALRRQNDSGQIDFAFRVSLIALVLSTVLILFKRPELNQSLVTILSLAGVCGILGAIAIGSQYIAQRHVEAGLTTLTANLYTPITIVLSTVFLNESLRPLQIIGTLFLLVSVVFVSSKHRLSKWRFDKYFWLMVLSGVCLGFVLAAERSLIKENGITAGTWVSWGASTLCLGVFTLIIGKSSQYNIKDTAVAGVFRFLQQLSWVILITVVANLSVAASVTTFKIVVIFAAAAVFLHEREDLKRKVIGSLIAVAGLLLMA